MRSLKIAGTWLLQALLAIVMVGPGYQKFTGPVWERMFRSWGYPDHFYLVIGAVEVIGGLALLIPKFTSYSAIVLAVVMLGALWLLAALVLLDPTRRYSRSEYRLLGIALILAIVNGFARPLVTFFSIPLVVLTLGLFLLVINALMFGLTIWISGELDLGLTSTGFGATFVGALIVAAVSWAGELVLGTE